MKRTASAPRVVRTQRGLRLVQGRDVLSDVLAAPGATGGLFDVLAACVVVFAPRRTRTRFAMLGFAAGGVVAPLRALGFTDRIDAVDLSHEALPLFREVSGGWAEPVHVAQDEAALWLRRRARPFDVVLEDLTVPGARGAEKPRVSVEVLPELVRRKLAPAGVVVVNVLPMPGMSWRELLARLAAPHRAALVVFPRDFENRVLIAGSTLPSAREATERLSVALGGIRSRQANRFSVRRLQG